MIWRATGRGSKRLRAGRTTALFAVVAAFVLAPAAAQAGFQEGIQLLPGQSTDPTVQATYAVMHAINGSVDRPNIAWAKVAPSTLPAGFNASDPGDKHYYWTTLDSQVRAAAAAHVTPILMFYDAPTWAEGPGPQKPYVSPGAWNPNPEMLAAFIHAVAERYSGNYPDPLHPGAKLPRVRYWEPWDEPNIPGYFSAPNQIAAYRTLLDRAYGALKAVSSSNVVALGGLAPVSPTPGSIPPINFAAAMMCMRPAGAGFRAIRGCRSAQFDVVDTHPYTLAATPTKHAYNAGDMLVGDMGKMAALMAAAHRRGLWATEFAWITNPPNSQLGDASAVAARYVAYSMYEMWKAGVSLVIWEAPVDIPGLAQPGSGLYTSALAPKLTLQAFAFPMVAGVGRGGGFAWGRVPTSHSVRVLVQRLAGRSWRTVARVRTASDGTFNARFRARGNGQYRARVIGGATSLSYDSRPIPPRRTHDYSYG
jgi:hypothetical protein